MTPDITAPDTTEFMPIERKGHRLAERPDALRRELARRLPTT